MLLMGWRGREAHPGDQVEEEVSVEVGVAVVVVVDFAAIEGVGWSIEIVVGCMWVVGLAGPDTVEFDSTVMTAGMTGYIEHADMDFLE
jgi:hypothetical protein